MLIDTSVQIGWRPMWTLARSSSIAGTAAFGEVFIHP